MSDDARTMASRQAGFSVVEAVVALALLAIVLALTSTALNASRHALRRVLANDGHASFVTSLRFIEQRLADVQPLYESRIGNRASIHFAGEPDRAVFLAAVEGADFSGGLYHVELGTRVAAAAGLALRMTPYVPYRHPVLPPVEQRVIDAAVSDIKIRYFGPDESGGVPTWHESWRGRAEVPFAIEMEAWRKEKFAGRIYVPLRPGRSMTSEER
jgi:Tfp pilus assembly protein PilE